MIRTCSSCGKKNRVPARHLANVGKCGDCGTALPAEAAPIDVQSVAEFDEIVNNAAVPVLVDFWADWCGPCRMAAPELKKAASELKGDGVVLKVDTMKLADLAARYKVLSIPNFIVFKDGEQVFQQAGLAQSHLMVDWVKQAG